MGVQSVILMQPSCFGSYKNVLWLVFMFRRDGKFSEGIRRNFYVACVIEQLCAKYKYVAFGVKG